MAEVQTKLQLITQVTGFLGIPFRSIRGGTGRVSSAVDLVVGVGEQCSHEVPVVHQAVAVCIKRAEELEDPLIVKPYLHTTDELSKGSDVKFAIIIRVRKVEQLRDVVSSVAPLLKAVPCLLCEEDAVTLVPDARERIPNNTKWDRHVENRHNHQHAGRDLACCAVRRYVAVADGRHRDYGEPDRSPERCDVIAFLKEVDQGGEEERYG
mmetsp:Transcript_36005/g.83771  ORF Transcript_36005/g.83771 Transcript_36005/m.83771 type:complete len:209 (+) Transcript_36005:64-690(+)